MRLFPRTFILIAVTLVVLALFMNTIIYDTVSDSMKDSEELAISFDMDRVESLLQREQEVQIGESEDVAYWTLFRDYMMAPNGTFIASMYFAGTLDFMNLNFILVYDLNGTFVEGVNYSFDTQEIVPITPELLEYVNDTSSIITFTNETDDHQLFASVGGQVALLTSSSILTDNGTGPSTGYTVIGRFIDDTEIETIAGLANVDLTALNTSGDLPTDVVEAMAAPSFNGTGRYYSVLGDDEIAMYCPLRSDDGSVLMVLKISDDRLIYHNGMNNFSITNIFLVIVLVAIGVVLLFFLNRNVVRPVSTLNKEMRRIGESGDLSARVQRSKNVDEIDELAVSLNGMMGRLEQNDTDLKESERRYRDLVENSNDWIWQTDHDFMLTFSNQAAVSQLGYGLDELYRTSLFDLIDAECLDGAASRVKEAGSPIPPQKGIITMRAKSGRKVIYEVNAQPILDGDGAWTGYRGVSRDITERVRNDRALEKTNRQLNLLSSITRHDILNQASVLSGYRHLLAEMVKDQVPRLYLEKQQKAIDTIERQIKFTGTYQKLGTQEPVWNDTLKILRSVINQAELRDLKVTVDVRPSEVLADPMMEKVFYNLIDNVLRHSGAKSLKISDTVRDGDLMIVFQDDGKGVPADQKEMIFELGFGQNTGLGLFLAREILAITNITIVENGGPGVGARFEVTIPRGHWRQPPVQ
ncbi:MAG: PAS domain S-box protein [Methanomassiliicoccales archaeon]|nr:PAS domain S-box protein [Methanomassiliicoccales archaeon]